MKKLLFFAAALLAAAVSIAQSSPGFVYGQTPSAAQWNSYFAAKMDAFSGALPLTSGGTGAINAVGAFANIMTGAGGSNGQYLRNNGTSFVAGSIQASDVPGIAGGVNGSVPYQTGASATTFLSGNASTTPKFLTSTGNGSTALAPTYTTSTGAGSVVLSTSPTLVSPALGTPASGVATNLTGTAASLTVGTATTVITNANLTGPISSTGNTTAVAAQTGTGSTFAMQSSPTLNTPTFVAPALGTPSSGVATNLTGTAASLTVGTATHVVTNANLTGVITSSGNATSIASQTGTGSKFVVDTSPVFTTDASSPKWRSTTAEVLFQGTGTGATQLASTQTTVPTCSSSCGISPSVVGTDSEGLVTMGATGTPASGWVLTFNGTWAAAPACVVQAARSGMVAGKAPIVVATTFTTFTVTTNGTAPGNGDIYAYICRGTS